MEFLEKEEAEGLLLKALESYQKITDSYLILHTQKGCIVINPELYNFQHLIGAEYSIYFKSLKIRPKNFPEKILRKEVTLLDLIDYDELINGEKRDDRNEWIYSRVLYLPDAIQSFIDQTVNIHKVKIQQCNSRDLDTDYLHIQVCGDDTTYLGLMGGDVNDFFYFNTFLINYKESIIGPSISVNELEVVPKDQFDETKYEFSKSPRNKGVKETGLRNQKKQKFDPLKSGNRNKIAKKLGEDYQLRKGSTKKSSHKLIYKDKVIAEFVFPAECTTLEECVAYIRKNYCNRCGLKMENQDSI